MLWDENFWESVLINYLSSVAAAMTLFVLGLGGYEAYLYKKRRKQKKQNKTNLT